MGRRKPSVANTTQPVIVRETTDPISKRTRSSAASKKPRQPKQDLPPRVIEADERPEESQERRRTPPSPIVFDREVPGSRGNQSQPVIPASEAAPGKRNRRPKKRATSVPTNVIRDARDLINDRRASRQPESVIMNSTSHSKSQYRDPPNLDPITPIPPRFTQSSKEQAESLYAHMDRIQKHPQYARTMENEKSRLEWNQLLDGLKDYGINCSTEYIDNQRTDHGPDRYARSSSRTLGQEYESRHHMDRPSRYDRDEDRSVRNTQTRSRRNATPSRSRSRSPSRYNSIVRDSAARESVRRDRSRTREKPYRHRSRSYDRYDRRDRVSSRSPHRSYASSSKYRDRESSPKVSRQYARSYTSKHRSNHQSQARSKSRSPPRSHSASKCRNRGASPRYREHTSSNPYTINPRPTSRYRDTRNARSRSRSRSPRRNYDSRRSRSVSPIHKRKPAYHHSQCVDYGEQAPGTAPTLSGKHRSSTAEHSTKRRRRYPEDDDKCYSDSDYEEPQYEKYLRPNVKQVTKKKILSLDKRSKGNKDKDIQPYKYGYKTPGKRQRDTSDSDDSDCSQGIFIPDDDEETDIEGPAILQGEEYAHVPQRFIKKIHKDEFVQFEYLIKQPNLEFDKRKINVEQKVDGQKITSTKKDYKPVTTWADWLSAFMVFAAIYKAKFKLKALNLMTYLQTVKTIYDNGGDFLYYDRRYRKARALTKHNTRTMNWSYKWDEIYSEARYKGLDNKIESKIAPNPPVKQAPNPKPVSKKGQKVRKDGFCWPYQNNNCHNREPCFRGFHKCQWCYQDHGGDFCPSRFDVNPTPRNAQRGNNNRNNSRNQPNQNHVSNSRSTNGSNTTSNSS